MSSSNPFTPRYGSNKVLTATSTPANASLDSRDNQIRIVNNGTQKAYVRTYSSEQGTVNINAAATDFMVAPGMASTLTKATHDTLSYISASGTTLEVVTGSGI